MIRWWLGWLKVMLRFGRIEARQKAETFLCCAHCGPAIKPGHVHFTPCTLCQYDGEIHVPGN